MTSTTETPTRSIKAILQEALNTIEATYWIQQAEFEWAPYLTTEADEMLAKPTDHFKEVVADTAWIGEQEGDPRYQTKDDGKTYTKITHVCSIGAIALSSAVLYTEPLAGYSAISERDPYTKGAGLVLANVLVTEDPGMVNVENPLDEIIASWNDKSDTTREDVLNAFRAAVESPLVEATALWQVRCPRYGTQLSPLFATEAECYAWKTGLVDALEDRQTPERAAQPQELLRAYAESVDEEMGWPAEDADDDTRALYALTVKRVLSLA